VTTNGNLISISGTAQLLVKDINLNGVAWPVTWTSVTSWTARVVLDAGSNGFQIAGADIYGKSITSTQTVVANFTGDTASPEGAVVFNEIQYNPAIPEATFVELYNRSSLTLDLGGWRVNGLDYTFPEGSIMAGGQYLVLAKSFHAMSAAHTTNVVIFDVFDGNLDSDGETLTLLKPGENGNPDLESEQALGFDASLRWRHARASGEVTFFVNRINNFIFRKFTGEVEEDLPVTFFDQGDARLQGFESHADFRLGDLWWAEGGLDYVRGTLTSTDEPLPRMPPFRGRVGLRFQKNAFQAGGEGNFTAAQDRIYIVDAAGETPTDGYGLLRLFASYSFEAGKAMNTITARLDNATGEVYVNHLNYLKDVLLENGYSEVGRNFKVVYSVRF
jgi:hypothetical protein